jgi:hypothetical protein
MELLLLHHCLSWNLLRLQSCTPSSPATRDALNKSNAATVSFLESNRSIEVVPDGRKRPRSSIYSRGNTQGRTSSTEMLASTAIFLQLANHCRVGYDYPKKRLPHMPIVRSQWKNFGFRADEACVPNLR